MTGSVVYFSRSGNSKRVAEQISTKLGFELIALDDQMNWNGFIGYMKAGYYTIKNKPVPMTLSSQLSDEAHLIVVSPLWAGGPAQVVRQFLTDRPLDTISLVLTSNASVANNLPNRDKYAYVGDIVKKMNNEQMIVGAVVKRFSRA